MASPRVSIATLAWHACLSRPDTDTERSGTVSASELQACAQHGVDRMGFRQTLTTVGHEDLPMSFQGAGIGAHGDRAVLPETALRDIAAAGDRSRQGTLEPLQTTLRIGADDRRVSVATP